MKKWIRKLGTRKIPISKQKIFRARGTMQRRYSQKVTGAGRSQKIKRAMKMEMFKRSYPRENITIGLLPQKNLKVGSYNTKQVRNSIST